MGILHLSESNLIHKRIPLTKNFTSLEYFQIENILLRSEEFYLTFH